MNTLGDLGVSLLLVLAQAPTPPQATESNTVVIVAAIGALGLVLSAVISVFGLRTANRLDSVEARVDGVGRDLGGRIDTLGARFDASVTRFEAAVGRLTERLDRLAGSARRSRRHGARATHREPPESCRPTGSWWRGRGREVRGVQGQSW
jgi:hypothetical protein